MGDTYTPAGALATERLFAASPQALFAAFAEPARLARWWGPKGFSNTFETFEFRPGGRWRFVMHGPDGKDYANENLFVEIEPPTRIVLEHVVPPLFRLTVTLTPRGSGTLLTWLQEFQSASFVEQLRGVLVPSNEENLDRLAAELVRPPREGG